MPNTSYIFSALAVAAGITFLLRLTPFVVKNALKDSVLLADLSKWIPTGALIILGVYVVAEIDYSSWTSSGPYLIGAVVTVALHLWRKNIALSLIVGTLICVILANWVF
ncbi:MAG: AzlD domain-containing protein [Rothia sp. (in: high G+C Gram-positive bacteria)]|nr:AzlD domain-containing protein [Rothia sp. (in: high G+C Gram-positive bacteria)]